MSFVPPTPDDIAQARTVLAGRVVRTPVLPLTSDRVTEILPTGAHVSMKLELFQQAGSFKARGALLGIDRLDPDQRTAGVVAASGGNHALAVAWAARASDVSAIVTMPKAADPVRVEGCRNFGADVRLMDDIATAFAEMEKIAETQGRTTLHPFEAEHMILGAATCGAELIEDCPDLDLVVVPVGGGGLIAGMATAIKQARPDCQVIGVEPVGADSLSQSFAAGEPVRIDKVATIADSLGSPLAMPHSFAVARQYVDRIVRIEDDEMRSMMRFMQDALKLTAEPACSATLAALAGPLKEHASGKRVGIIACGSNISQERFRALTER